MCIRDRPYTILGILVLVIALVFSRVDLPEISHVATAEAVSYTHLGVKEDVTNIILNLKQVRFKQVVEEFENEKVSITVEN